MPIPELDTKVGGMNVGAGPEDLSSPAAPPQTQNNIPQVSNPFGGGEPQQPQLSFDQPTDLSQQGGGVLAPPQRAPASPSDVKQAISDNRVNAFMKSQEAHLPEAEKEKANSAAFANRLKGIESLSPDAAEATDPKSQAQQSLFEKLKSGLTEDLQQIKGKFRTGIARNGVEQQNGLEQVFGQGNVKFVGDEFWVRPETGSWRKFKSEEHFGSMINPLMNYAARKLMELPEMASHLPGDVARMGGQAIGAAGGFALGNLPGAVAGGFAGGVTGSKIGKSVDQKMNEFLNQNDPTFQYQNRLSSIGDALQNDYVQGAMGAVQGGMYAHAAKRAANAVALAERGIVDVIPEGGDVSPVTATTKILASPEESQFSKYVSAVKSFKDVFFSPVETEGVQAGLTPGQDALGVSKKIMNDLGDRISALKGDAAQLQMSKNSYLQPDNFTQFVQKELKKHGVVFDADGMVNYGETTKGTHAFSSPSGNGPSEVGAGYGLSYPAQQPEAPGKWVTVGGGETINQTELNGTAPANIKTLMKLSDEAVSSKVFSKEQGMTAQRAEDFLSALSSHADYEMQHPSPNSSEELFRGARDALDSDRISHYHGLFGGEDSEAARLFSSTMRDYSQKIGSYRQVTSAFDTPGKVELMGKKLSAQGSAKALDAMDNFAVVLGTDSPQYKNLRSDVLSNIIDKSVDGGKINAKMISGYFKNKDNQPLLNRLFDGDVKSKNLMGIILSQGEEMQTATEMSLQNKGLIKEFTKMAADKLGAGKYLNFVAKLMGNSKSGMDYASQACLDLIHSAVGQEQKEAMMQQLNSLDSFRSRAQVIDVPMKVDGRVQIIKKYMPQPTDFIPGIR